MAEQSSTGGNRLVIAELAYKEAVRGGDRRSASLNTFRERAATVFTVAVLATTFFGQAVAPDLEFLSWVAILVFVVGVVLPGVVILMPIRTGWAFGLSPTGILDKSPSGTTDVEALEKAARAMEKTHKKADAGIDRLAVLLIIQCVALCFEVVVWTVDLAGR